MGIDLWNHSKFLHHKVRNITRRGYLLKTYNDGKILKARVKTGEKIENDQLDVIHPVGYVAHVAPSEKTEILTMDVGADTSRRVVLAVLGDREYHPKPDEGEMYIYAPGDNGVHMRIKKAGSSSAQSRDSSGNRDSGRAAGIHLEGKDQAITAKSTATFSVEASQGITLKASNHTFDGDVLIKGNLNVEHDLRIGGEGYKPGDGPWAAGGVAAASTTTARTTSRALPLADVMKYEDGKVTIDADLIVNGDLCVKGTVTAKDFVRV